MDETKTRTCEECEHLRVKLPVRDINKYDKLVNDKIIYNEGVAGCELGILTFLDEITPKFFKLGARLKANVKNYSGRQIYKDWTMANACPKFVKANLKDLFYLIQRMKKQHDLNQARKNQFSKK